MKALMSVAALMGAAGILLLAAMTVGIVPSNTVRLIEGYMPVQVIAELTLFVAGFTGLSYMMAAMGMAFPRFWQGILFWAFLLIYLKFRIYPPIPFSVRAMYGTISLVAIFMWVSANEEDWKKFKQPIMNVLDAKTGGTKALRIGYLFIIPILIGGFSYNAMVPKSEEPIELRTVHPAPPASTKVHGKTYTLQTSQNPYRVNPEGKYDQEYSNANIVEQGMGRLMKPNANPWDKDAKDTSNMCVERPHAQGPEEDRRRQEVREGNEVPRHVAKAARSRRRSRSTSPRASRTSRRRFNNTHVTITDLERRSDLLGLCRRRRLQGHAQEHALRRPARRGAGAATGAMRHGVQGGRSARQGRGLRPRVGHARALQLGPQGHARSRT